MPTEYLNPAQLCPTFGWTHVAVTTGGKTIHISGQVAVDEKGDVVGKGDLRAQTDQAFRNIQHALKAAGATFADVVKTNLYVVGLKPEHVPIIREVRARRMDVVRTALIPAAVAVGTGAALLLISTDGSLAPPSPDDSMSGEIEGRWGAP